MKLTGTCPKCQSNEVYAELGAFKRGERGSIPLGNWTHFYVDMYICTQCGYLEEYMTKDDLENTKKLEKLKKIWQKAKG